MVWADIILREILRSEDLSYAPDFARVVCSVSWRSKMAAAVCEKTDKQMTEMQNPEKTKADRIGHLLHSV